MGDTTGSAVLPCLNLARSPVRSGHASSPRAPTGAPESFLGCLGRVRDALSRHGPSDCLEVDVKPGVRHRFREFKLLLLYLLLKGKVLYPVDV